MIGVGGGGSAVLYAGGSPDKPPTAGIVEFDNSVSDKIAAALRWMLAYPDRPTD
jgi:hypothetical protein